MANYGIIITILIITLYLYVKTKFSIKFLMNFRIKDIPLVGGKTPL